MMNRLFKAVTPEEAAVLTQKRPFLPYNPEPVISKPPKNAPLQPIEPLKVFDNVYWMGSKAVGVIVIDTGDGFMMIDSGSDEREAAHIARSFAEMGLDASKIRLIVISHEHFDHYGGLSWFKKEVCPDALTAMSRTGWNLLQTVPTEFAFTQPRPQNIDIFMEDGLCLKTGNTELLCM